jgi:hypothetical protein
LILFLGSAGLASLKKYLSLATSAEIALPQTTDELLNPFWI